MAPSITGITGPVSHGEAVVILGEDFKTKSPAAPLIWDNCSHGDAVLVSAGGRWSARWPSEGDGLLDYRTPAALGRGVALPHDRITAYLTGSHYPATGNNDGDNVAPMTTYTKPAMPYHSFWAWYARCDPAWVFNLSATPDNNHKRFGFSVGGRIYAGDQQNWYTSHAAPGFDGEGSMPQWVINDDQTGATRSLQNPDQNGHNFFWNFPALNPWAGWIFTEHILRITNQNDGYIKVYEDGIPQVDYLGSTDKYTTTTRTEGVEGYSRNNGSETNNNNWRYLADLYYDRSLARVALGNADTWAASTVRAMQIPSAWATGAITVEVNAGAFADDEAAYLFVFDPDGTVSAGFAVTIGAAGASPSATRPRTRVEIVRGRR